MTAIAIETRRELAHRSSHGIEVTLFWSKPSNRVTVEVFDTRSGEGFEFEVEGGDALDAFHHPYAYAASRAVRSPLVAGASTPWSECRRYPRERADVAVER